MAKRPKSGNSRSTAPNCYSGRPPTEVYTQVGLFIPGGLPQTGVTPKGRPGRKKHSGEFDDSLALEAMAQLLAAGKAKSRRDAARQVADQVKGNSPEAKMQRLAPKFVERFQVAEPAPGSTWADVLEGKLKAN